MFDQPLLIAKSNKIELLQGEDGSFSILLPGETTRVATDQETALAEIIVGLIKVRVPTATQTARNIKEKRKKCTV